jgi:hypothetical protein
MIIVMLAAAAGVYFLSAQQKKFRS